MLSSKQSSPLKKKETMVTKIIAALSVVLLMLAVACSSEESVASTVDIEATVDARLATAIASQPIPTAKVIVEEITKILEVEKIVEVEVVKEVIKEVEVVVVKEVPVEKIVEKEVIVVQRVEVVVTATATPMPAATPTAGMVYTWDQLSLEYENNRILFQSKYLNRPMTIRGQIQDIRYWDATSFGLPYGSSDVPTVWIMASYESGANSLFCGLGSVDELVDLSSGATVIVTGTIVGDDGDGWLYAYPCSIED